MNTLRASVLVVIAAALLISCSSAPRKPRPECTLPDLPDQAGLTPGKPIKQVKPAMMRSPQGGGFACVAVTIDVEGRPTDLEVLATDDPVFAESVLHALAQWRFEPTLRDGTPVPFRTVITMDFTHL